MDFSTKKIQEFINNARSISHSITTDEMIFQEIFSLMSDIKLVHTMALKKLLVKTIIIFTSIYFESYCNIPA